MSLYVSPLLTEQVAPLFLFCINFLAPAPLLHLSPLPPPLLFKLFIINTCVSFTLDLPCEHYNQGGEKGARGKLIN